ncbi:VirB4 family type IV secretion/conjugal transfer ATPase [Rubrivivax albus]|uniref:VirB4 family type IV secretion/conjugal transfer ATPase n=1 Tax=Rubrivivax albus TaxID=2499835 RepID=A0A437JU24_9BURK|nr:VirB4 family type IV secretion/conjugal transfer ATPase [Rubrivivax albus]RVT50763.1 VirB4 family type IV secretion/conjugal transfer ATPase [Rubrivivax albus]
MNAILSPTRLAPRPRHWQRALHENPLERFVPYSSLLGEHEVMTRGGDLLRCWRLQGLPFECADEALVADRHEALCNLLRNLAGGVFAIWTHRIRRRVQDRLDDPPAPGFARDLSQAHGEKHHRAGQMSTALYLTLLYRHSTASGGTALRQRQRTRDEIGASVDEARRIMAEQAAMLERQLQPLGPKALGLVQRNGLPCSEVAEFLGFLVNGVWQPMPARSGALFRQLPAVRLNFGADKLEIRHGDERRFAAFVDLQEYTDAVEPGVLDALLYEDSEFIETQSFSILPRREAMNALTLQRNQLIASDDVVVGQIDAMDQALNDLGDGQFCMGEYHHSLMVFGSSAPDAGRRAAQAAGAVGESSGLQLRPVDLVADAAWFAQMPGNWAWRPRRARLTSRAFAALAAPHGFAQGKRDGNPWGQALALLRTPGGQPFYLNLHASPPDEDSLGQKLPGNTLIVGSTGSGKTTLVSFLLAMTRKWTPAPRLVLFDLDRGSEILVRALGGRYFALEAGVPTGCNPLQQDATPARIQFWITLVRTCLDTPALPLLPADERAIAAAVQTVAALPTALRRMSAIRQNLPVTGSNSLHDRLGRWCAGGALGWVFDECDDWLGALDACPVIGFDTTAFLDLPEVRTPVMLFLLQRMGELIDGRRLIYTISEFWKVLDHPAFAEFAKVRQKTIRKHDGLGIFDTQSPSDVLRHAIGRTMVEQSVTQVFLPNAAALRDEYVEGFGLSSAEFEIVRTLGARGGHPMLVKQGATSAICELDLHGLDEYLPVLSGTTDNVALLDAIRTEVGDDPAAWLPRLQRAARARRPSGVRP